MVAVISCAAAAIWLVLLDCVFALAALCTARALIWLVALESVSAPLPTDSITSRSDATLVFKRIAQPPDLVARRYPQRRRQVL